MATINDLQDEVVEEFQDFTDWMDKYQMLIDLGNELAPLDEKYKNEQNNKVKLVEGKDYNVNPFSVSYVAQIGWDDWGVYAKYTPTGFFKEGKGPEIQAISLGIQFGF